VSDTTTFENKCEILAELWTEYKNDTQFEDFFSYNDLGLPLAYAVSTQIVKSTKLAEEFINETFALLLDVLGIESDTGFETLADVLMLASS
jgi:hypothetical protein